MSRTEVQLVGLAVLVLGFLVNQPVLASGPGCYFSPKACDNVNQHLVYTKAPDHSGCGARGAELYKDIPNAVRCCRAHDICYSKAGVSKIECDLEMDACFKMNAWNEAIAAASLAFVCPAYIPAQNDYLACKPFATLKEADNYVGCFKYSFNSFNPTAGSIPAFKYSTAQVNANPSGPGTVNGDVTTLLSVQACKTECASRKFKFAGLTSAGQCWCDNNISATKVADSECDVPCRVDLQQMCGGNLLLDLSGPSSMSASVYRTGYVGCFRDMEDRDLPTQATSTPRDYMGNSGYVPVMCMAECQQKNKRYAGIQAGGECFCGDTYGKHGAKAETECSFACDAILEVSDSLQNRANYPMSCGGSWANAIFDTSVALAGHKMYSFSIRSQWNDLCLTWDGSNDVPRMQTCSADSALQQWVFDGGFAIHPLTNNRKCLDASGGVTNGAQIIVYPCNGGENQKWIRQDDTFINSQYPGKCFDILGSNANPGANIGTWDCWGGGNQKWLPLKQTINFKMIVTSNQLYSFPDYEWVDVDPATNYAVGRGNGGWDCLVKTSYSKIYVDRKTMRIDTSKMDYSSSEPMPGYPASCASRKVPYGTAAMCQTSGEATSMINLSNTKYVVTSQFNYAGWQAHGSVVASNNGRTLTISGGGYCGWMATNDANAALEEGAIQWGGQHIKVEMPRSPITDAGYGHLLRGWYDVQQQGKKNDYCRYVGDSPNIFFSCVLAGSTNQYALSNVNPVTLGEGEVLQSDCVIVYKDCLFDGSTLTIGSSLSNFGNDFNDAVSSLRIAPGCSATFYTDANYQGSAVTFTKDVSCLGSYNDVFSSATCSC